MKELSLENCRLDGRYDVTSLLGRGSYAEIYVARDTLAAPQSPHSLVVIKALNVFMQDDLDADLERTLVENFQNEAIALDRVRHPNIISRLGHGTAKDLHGTVFHYLVLEYLPGGDLSKLCRKQNLPLSESFNYIEQVCAGLGYAHQSGVIHRDIKPQNLLLTGDRKTVKIADFGVARFDHSDAPITRVGTNIYAPPEHSPIFANDENALTVTELTPAADVYSLAKSTYVLVACESPRKFANLPITELPAAIRQKPWADEFLRVLRKATQTAASERQQSVNEFWRDLTKVKTIADAEENETETQVGARPHLVPQASVTRDFSPEAPILPKFNTSRDLKLKDLLPETAANNPRLVVQLNGENEIVPPAPPPDVPELKTKPEHDTPPARRRRGFAQRAGMFLLLPLVFAGALFATHVYLRSQGLASPIQNPFASKPEGVAVQDINLRPTAGVDNQPIGLVPKDSRVRILSTLR